MKKMIMALSFGLCSVAHAQTYAQPIREVENEASQPVHAACEMTWSLTEGHKQCNLFTVPVGKRLVLKQANARCLGRTGDTFGPLRVMSHSATWTISFTPFVAVPKDDFLQIQRVASTSLHQYADGNQALSAGIYFEGTPTTGGPPQCSIFVTGYLVSIQ
jgi:hypothetical protein